jgi:hypothetical protein
MPSGKFPRRDDRNAALIAAVCVRYLILWQLIVDPFPALSVSRRCVGVNTQNLTTSNKKEALRLTGGG